MRIESILFYVLGIATLSRRLISLLHLVQAHIETQVAQRRTSCRNFTQHSADLCAAVIAKQFSLWLCAKRVISSKFLFVFNGRIYWSKFWFCSYSIRIWFCSKTYVLYANLYLRINWTEIEISFFFNLSSNILYFQTYKFIKIYLLKSTRL